MAQIKLAAVPACVGFALAWVSALPVSMAAPDPTARPPGERVRELQRERVKVLEDQLEGLFGQMAERKDLPSTYLEAIRELGEAELELADGRSAEQSVLERTLRRFQEAEEKIHSLWVAGLQTKQGVALAKAARLKAEIQFEKRKAAR